MILTHLILAHADQLDWGQAGVLLLLLILAIAAGVTLAEILWRLLRKGRKS